MFQPLMFIAELQKSCEVTLAMNGDADMKAVSEMSGVPIDVDRLRVVPIDSRRPFVAKREWLAFIVRTRKLKALAKGADVCISTANVMDFGKPAHHFLYLLSQFGGHAFYDYLMGRRGGFGVRRILRRINTAFYENVVKPLFGVRPLRRIIADRRERIYPTSAYVEGIVRGYFGPFNSKVFYPPTTFEFNDASVARDPLLAIYVGRIFPPKRITDIIAIAERAREISGKDLKLHIAGRLTEIPYVNLLRKMAAERPWLKLVGSVYGSDKERFMLSATYALHAERDEAFGIAIAEYLKAGCIPIVPDVGGPAEIVGSPALEFRDNETAAETLSRLLCDDAFREEQRRMCAARAADFSLKAYKERQRMTIEEMLAR
jgi:glycosyltransferase involved in cell wall biosynthesis